MPLPVAHALVGAALATALWPDRKRSVLLPLSVGAFLGALPDSDYLLNMLRLWGGGWHHGFTHSLLFAVVVGAGAACAARVGNGRGILACATAALSHPLLDYLVTESRGIALFWPWTNHRFKLAAEAINYYQLDRFAHWGRLGSLLAQCAVELLLFTPLLLLALWLYRRAQSRAPELA